MTLVCLGVNLRLAIEIHSWTKARRRRRRAAHTHKQRPNSARPSRHARLTRRSPTRLCSCACALVLVRADRVRLHALLYRRDRARVRALLVRVGRRLALVAQLERAARHRLSRLGGLCVSAPPPPLANRVLARHHPPGSSPPGPPPPLPPWADSHLPPAASSPFYSDSTPSMRLPPSLPPSLTGTVLVLVVVAV